MMLVFVLTARIEGTKVLLTDPDCNDEVEAVYEFRLLLNGEPEVVAVEDACAGRASVFPGVYAPVP